jgi:hypothetical protein
VKIRFVVLCLSGSLLLQSQAAWPGNAPTAAGVDAAMKFGTRSFYTTRIHVSANLAVRF